MLFLGEVSYMPFLVVITMYKTIFVLGQKTERNQHKSTTTKGYFML